MSTDSVADECSTDGEEMNPTRGAQMTNRRTVSGKMYADIAKAIVAQMSLTHDTIESISKHESRSEFWEEVRKTCCKTGKKMDPKTLYFIWRQNRGNMKQIVSALLSSSPGSEKLPEVTKLSHRILPSVTKTNQETPSTRKVRAKKVTPEGFINTEKVFARQKKTSSNDPNKDCAICKQENDDVGSDEIQWIMCDICRLWYHCTCLEIDNEALPYIYDKDKSKKVKFHCGASNCESNKLELTFKRNRKFLNLPINQERRKNLEKFAAKPIFVHRGEEKKDNDSGPVDKESDKVNDCPDTSSDNNENKAFDRVAFDALSLEERTSVNGSPDGPTIDLMESARLDRAPMQHETLESLSHCKLPGHFFKRNIEPRFDFNFSRDEWTRIPKKNRKNGNVSFASRDWCSTFNKILAQGNPFCNKW